MNADLDTALTRLAAPKGLNAYWRCRVEALVNVAQAASRRRAAYVALEAAPFDLKKAAAYQPSVDAEHAALDALAALLTGEDEDA